MLIGTIYSILTCGKDEEVTNINPAKVAYLINLTEQRRSHDTEVMNIRASTACYWIRSSVYHLYPCFIGFWVQPHKWHTVDSHDLGECPFGACLLTPLCATSLWDRYLYDWSNVRQFWLFNCPLAWVAWLHLWIVRSSTNLGATEVSSSSVQCRRIFVHTSNSRHQIRRDPLVG